MDIVLTSLAAFTVTEFLKLHVPVKWNSRSKALVAVLFASIFYMLEGGRSPGPTEVFAAGGGAFLIHALFRALRSWSDVQRTQVLKTVTRAVSLPNTPGH